MDITKLDVMSLMPMIVNIMDKIDLKKLQKSADIDSAVIIYKICDGKLQLNLKTEPESKEFYESFIEILKVVLSANPKTKIIFKEL